MPEKTLEVLLVEDNPADAELMVRELKRTGFMPHAQRVETEAEYLERLRGKVDLILSDYQLPEFSGLRALQRLNELQLDIPFIIVSGTIGEETAVAAMREGADDYLLKDRIARLGEAVRHALAQRQLRAERRAAEEKLSKLMRRHQLILDSSAEGIHGINLAGRITFENRKSLELLGWTSEELIGRAAHETIHHSHADGSAYPVESCPIYESMRDGKTRRVTNDVFWRKDGRSFRVDYVSAPVRDDEGKIVGCIVTFKDNTEQYVAEQRLKLQEQQYRLLFETNPNPMWVFDSASLAILAVNDAALAQYGYSREEFLRLRLSDLRLPEEEEALQKALTGPRAPAHFSGEFRHCTKEGTLINVLIYSSPLLWNGTAARMVTAIDVTERKRSEERLRQQSEIIDRAHDAIIMRNYDDQRIVFWNKGAERLYGWTAEERIGLSEATTLANRADVDRVLNSLHETGEFHGELKQFTKTGDELIAEVRATLVRDDQGAPRSILVICTDVTEQKHLEMQLLRAQRLESIGTLASGVAHDLNNILTPILMGADSIDDQGDPDVRAALDLILASAHRGASVVKQVLTFARGIEGERVRTNPRHLIEEMADIARSTFPKTIEIRTNYPKELWSVAGDPTQLHQVLLNLAVNARDAMPQGGTLEIAAENIELDETAAAKMPEGKPGAYVLLRVSDSGAGMSQDTVEKIFHPFFTTKEIGKGTGLGLSTTLGIVKSHDGFIVVESAPGRGTTFRVFLPASDVQLSAAEAAKTDIARGRNEQILVIDDEEIIRFVTKSILEENGYQVLEAKDGPEALAVFRQAGDAIQLILTDLMLPQMDGGALVHELRKIDPSVPIIVSTGADDPQIQSALEASGVEHFLGKPYGRDQLLAMVDNVLAAARQRTA